MDDNTDIYNYYIEKMNEIRETEYSFLTVKNPLNYLKIMMISIRLIYI